MPKLQHNDIVDVWVTKYCLTKGIQRETGCKVWTSGTNVYVRANGQIHNSYKIGTEAFLDKAEALVNSEQRRQKKITSLNKQIAKLKKLTFE